jgi:predicted ATPase
MNKHLNYIEVRWKNFKGFKDTGWVKIKPITIILGSNNCGKTSFLAPFLLMNQTVNSGDRISPLILKGDMFDGGNYQEIVKDYITENEIFFGYKYHIHDSDEKLEPLGSYPPGGFEVTFKVESKDEEIKLKKKTIYDIFQRKFLSLSLQSNGKYKYSGIGFDGMNKMEKEAILNSEPINFLFSPNTVLSDFESKQEENEENEKIKRKVVRFTKGFSQFLSAISYNNSRVRQYLGDLSFIGPIRDNPHRIYEITNETYSTVGSKGENMPNLIKKIGDENEELNSWIKKFGFGDRIQLKHHYSNTYSLRFLKDDTTFYTSIANAGFGASQVLPLIVQAVVSPKRSITIAEQPEIHLNPKIQCELAELFSSMAKKGQTVIIETHSEHLLLRIRRLIAEEKLSSDDVAIYFVERKDQESSIKEIKLQENGHIKPIDWPKDFFGESLKEAIAMASEQAKRKKK